MGKGGSGGANGTVNPNASNPNGGGNGGAYGGGAASGRNNLAGGNGGGGAVRVLYPGTTRSYPSTNTGNL
jgi:hypothetical protein